ncbi:MAG: winged helix-turn-helix domain-containing protein [Bacilli bacterium]
MIDVLFFNTSTMNLEFLHKYFEEDKYNMTVAENMYDVFLKNKNNNYKLILIYNDFSDISVNLFVKLIELDNRYVKLVFIHNNNYELEENIYKYGTGELINFSSGENVFLLQLGQILNSIENDSKTKAYDSITNIIVDFETSSVTKEGISISLSSTEFLLLKLLISNKDITLSRKEIEKTVWGNNLNDFENREIDVYVSKLRKKLGVSSIKTVRGIGYCWDSK